MPAYPPSCQATWSIPPSVRRALARLVLDLRRTLEDDLRRQLAALGIRETGIQPPPGGRTLSPHDERARASALAAIQREVEGGASHAAALETYVREAAYTFLNRVVGLRCLEERGLLLVDGQTETAIKVLPSFNAPSLYWRVRNELSPSTSPREVWRETLRRACCAVSQPVRVVLSIQDDDGALLPLQVTLQRVMEAFNGPDIPSETYGEDELLGWVYQYYNQQEKAQVYESLGRGQKLERPEELAAATCLYTERYMVDYLLQNTLGALWVEMHPDSTLPQNWPYYVRPPEGNPKPQRPVRRLRDITLMDPACGSGHFLVRAFDLLAQMYAEERVERPEEVDHLILEHNLHGIDIDLRAVQIAALALYLKGCALAGPGFRPRRLNLVPADAVLPGDMPPKEYMKRFQGDPEMEALVTGIWQGLRNVRELGSLLHPERAVDEVVGKRAAEDRRKFPMLQRGEAEWALWKSELLRGLREEFERQAQSEDLGQRLFGEEAAKGVGLVEALGRRYDVVVTNPPYAGSKNLNPRLKAFLEKEYKEGKRDLYAAFILRCSDFCKAGGYVGMVTQQSWMFLRSFSALRKGVLEHTSITTLPHLGEHGFEESAAAGAFVALFTLGTASPPKEHRMTAFRLVGPKTPVEKEAVLRQAVAGKAPSVVSMPRQADFLSIPEMPFVYWLRPRFFELLKGPTVGDFADVPQGASIGDVARFVRHVWEVWNSDLQTSLEHKRWVRFEKGGGYAKWAGLDMWVVDWENNGARIKNAGLPGTLIRNEAFFFRTGWIYSSLARGSLGLRLVKAGLWGSVMAAPIFLRGKVELPVGAVGNARVATAAIRWLRPQIVLSENYVTRIPLPSPIPTLLSVVESTCVALKRSLASQELLERNFSRVPLERAQDDSLLTRWQRTEKEMTAVQSFLHTLEGLNERLVCEAYGLDEGDVQAVLDETGTPAGWHSLIAGYDTLPEPPHDMSAPDELYTNLKEHLRRTLKPEELSRLKDRLRALYQAGPGATVDEDTEDGDDENEAILGARIPIPPETFLEELSQKLEVHPISVYWLLKEMREQEGLVCPPEIQRHLEDYVSVTVLRLLGYRWPQQDAYEREHGPILDPSLVDEDGIIPLVPCADQPTAAQRVRMRLERQFGEEGAARSEVEFRQWVGRTIEEWLCRDFFRRHVQQFKQRPIAWHLASPERTFEAFVLYHKLSRATLQKLRAQYAGSLIARLQAEQARARERAEAAAASRLQAQIEDVEEFRARIEAIERGDELKYRIRCRWKGEEATGRPGPYASDIDDGVKVNVRPFQEAGLLAIIEVIKKW